MIQSKPMKTVGEILKKARLEKNLDYDVVEKRTKIRKKFLAALEKNDWSSLPSPTYIKGFIRNYSRFLGLKPEEMVAIFRRHYTGEEKSKPLPDNISQPLHEPFFRITSQKIIIASTILFIILFSGYLFIQYRAFTGEPALTVITPKEGEILKSTTVSVRGETDRDATLYINNQKTSIDSSGAFHQDVILNPGINTLLIESESKLGKKSKLTRTIQIE